MQAKCTCDAWSNIGIATFQLCEIIPLDLLGLFTLMYDEALTTWVRLFIYKNQSARTGQTQLFEINCYNPIDKTRRKSDVRF